MSEATHTSGPAVQPRAEGAGDEWSPFASPRSPDEPSKQSHQSSDPHTPVQDAAWDPESSSPCDGNPSIDAISYTLSRQHLRLDVQDHSQYPRVPIAPCSSAIPYTTTAGFSLEVDPAYQQPPLSVESRSHETAPTLAPAGSHADHADRVLENLSRPRASIIHDNASRRRKPSSWCQNDTGFSAGEQDLTEGMVRSGEQYNGRSSPFSNPPSSGPHDASEMDIDPPTMEFGENPGDGTAPENPLIEAFLAARGANGALGVRENGLPLYRSSRDTALRCQNLVRNKPRMRKRNKLRNKPSNSVISAAANSTPTSAAP